MVHVYSINGILSRGKGNPIDPTKISIPRLLGKGKAAPDMDTTITTPRPKT